MKNLTFVSLKLILFSLRSGDVTFNYIVSFRIIIKILSFPWKDLGI